MAIYMKVPGVDGSATTKGYEKWIKLSTLDFSVMRHVGMETGNMANRAAGLPQFNELAVSKELEQATYGILHEAVLGKEGKKIEIAVVETDDPPRENVRYELEDAIFSSYSMSAINAEGAKPVENANLTFSKIDVSFKSYDKAGKPGPVSRVTYNLTTGSK